VKLTSLLWGAAAAAVLLTAGVVVSIVRDPAVQDCAGALAAADAANAALIDTYGPLDRAEVRARHGDDEAAGVPAARLLVEQRRLELEAARVAVTRLCHYSPDPAPADPAQPSASGGAR
jgi:hypothetical protein